MNKKVVSRNKEIKTITTMHLPGGTMDPDMLQLFKIKNDKIASNSGTNKAKKKLTQIWNP
jgi:hypothetical protein